MKISWLSFFASNFKINFIIPKLTKNLVFILSDIHFTMIKRNKGELISGPIC